MVTGLRHRTYPIAAQDLDWYCEAYLRAAQRLNQERNRSTGLNTERLARKLQYLYDRIIEGLAEDKRRREKAGAAKLAIIMSLTDRRLPVSLAPHFELPSDDEPPAPEPDAA